MKQINRFEIAKYDYSVRLLNKINTRQLVMSCIVLALEEIQNVNKDKYNKSKTTAKCIILMMILCFRSTHTFVELFPFRPSPISISVNLIMARCKANKWSLELRPLFLHDLNRSHYTAMVGLLTAVHFSTGYENTTPVRYAYTLPSRKINIMLNFVCVRVIQQDNNRMSTVTRN